MRQRSKASTAKCNCSLYTLFLLAEPKYVSCVRLGEILAEVSHDSVNRFLLRECYKPEDLFNEVKEEVELEAGILSVDDSVEDKPYREVGKSALVGYFWSGKHKRTVKGIDLTTLYYTDPSGRSYPVNYRLYDKQEGKTKNDDFREMVIEVQQWGLKPAWITGDSWFSSLDNLKFLRNEEVGFLFGIANNRQVSLEPGKLVQVHTLEIPPTGLVVYLKKFGWVKVFCQSFKNVRRYYILFSPHAQGTTEAKSEQQQLTLVQFKQLHDSHWQIEYFHRVIKQVCNIERFYVRQEQAIRNHFFCALRAFTKLQSLSIQGVIQNAYEISRQLFIPVIREFICTYSTEATFA
ncbi:MAG: transposase [Spirulina sp. SIO3F2]|nr:transposase [Spirulina sp. SIO3F2]